MRTRSMILLVSLAMLGAVGCRAQEEPELSPTPAATQRPEVQLEGTVRAVLSPTQAEAVDEDVDEADDDATPDTSPAADVAGGGIVVQLTALSESLEDCGLDAGDTVAVFWTSDTVIEQTSVARDARFPENLTGQKVLAAGHVEAVAGQCTLVANRLEVGASASPSPTPDDDDDDASPTPTARATASPTARATAAPTPTESPDETP